MILERGALLNNRYRIIEILGQGGMGSVYRAVDENLGMEVAVKDNLFTTDEYARQFRREAVILANLRHPNLPRVTDHFVIESQGQYLVMDYIEGEDLRQRMDRVGTIGEDESITIGAAVCDALTYLDTRRPSIVHRDIKPGNVKINPQGQIFLVDFGLAKTIQGSQATTTGARAMTPGYSPPEQYGTARTDQRSDIFSLGATLYAALTGAIPEDALARAMEQVDLTPVRKHNPKISRRLANVIEKSLCIRPEDRYQNAEEFKGALLAARTTSRRRNGEYLIDPPPDLEDRPLPGDSPLLSQEVAESLPRRDSSPSALLPTSQAFDDEPVVERKSRSRPRRRRQPIGCGTILLIAAGTLVLALLGLWLAPRQMFASTLARLFSPGLPITQTTSILTGGVTATPGDSSISAITQPSPTEIAALPSATPTIAQPPTPTPLPSPSATPEPTSTPIIEPTPMGGGGQIAFASDVDGKIQIWQINSDSSGLKQITQMDGGACQPAWSPDGARLAFVSPCEGNREIYLGSAIFVINVDGTGLTPLNVGSSLGDYDPAWSPDGKKIAFTSIRTSGRPEIYIFNLEDNKLVSLSEKYSRDMQPSWSFDGKQIIFISQRRGSNQVWVMNADGSNQQQFSRGPNLINSRPVWSPDGKSILFTRLLGQGGIPKLMGALFDLETYEEYRITQDQIPMREASWSPDGNWMAFEGWPAGSNHDIYLLAANGAGRKQVTTNARMDFDAAWKPAP